MLRQGIIPIYTLDTQFTHTFMLMHLYNTHTITELLCQTALLNLATSRHKAYTQTLFYSYTHTLSHKYIS